MPGDECPSPEILYKRDNKDYTFISGYAGDPIIHIGEKVNIIYDPTSEKAEQVTWENRWIFTFAPLGFSILCILLCTI